MQQDNSYQVNPVLLKYLFDISPEELLTINSHTKGFSDEELTNFCTIYRSKRKDPQTILILCLLGLVMVGGLHRFAIRHTGMGILYFFTGGLCLIGTIVDAINYQRLTMEYNGQMISETLVMLNMIKR